MKNKSDLNVSIA